MIGYVNNSENFFGSIIFIFFRHKCKSFILQKNSKNKWGSMVNGIQLIVAGFYYGEVISKQSKNCL